MTLQYNCTCVNLLTKPDLMKLSVGNRGCIEKALLANKQCLKGEAWIL